MQVATKILSHKDFLRIDKDYETAAEVASLIYVSDKSPGIKRVKKGKGFTFLYKGRAVNDKKTLERIKKIVIPPAWTDVWICPDENGHIQATGYDLRRRKQYRYHQRWIALQQETKFHRMIEFGKALPQLRKQVEKDLAQPNFCEQKMMATVISVMERTFIRVGNEGYEKLYGSYGLTTLKNEHVSIQGDKVTFSFKGKKGVYHKITLKNKKFARIIRQCKAIPGKELFQYYDENGEVKKVDSGQVNQYLKNCLGMDFTTKDFRTWAGTLSMLGILKESVCSCAKDYIKNIKAGFEQVSQKLGNTVAVCKKYYVHPEIVRMYQDQALTEYFALPRITDQEKEFGLSCEEELLMKILKVVQKQKTELTLSA